MLHAEKRETLMKCTELLMKCYTGFQCQELSLISG
jgi:hypothetical protein